MALRYSGNTYDAEDMVQETLYIALRKFSHIRDEARCKNWLFAILRSIYLKELRLSCRKKKFEYDERLDYVSFLEEAVDNFDTEKAFEKKIESSQIHCMVEKLPEKYKSPVLLFYMEELSYQQISGYLDIPVGTVMSRLSRARKHLKKEMLRTLRKDSYENNVVEFKKIKKHVGPS